MRFFATLSDGTRVPVLAVAPGVPTAGQAALIGMPADQLVILSERDSGIKYLVPKGSYYLSYEPD